MRAFEIGTSPVIQAAESMTIAEAACAMGKHQAGCLVVTRQNEAGRPVPLGIVTDRDLVIRALARKLDPAVTAVRCVMSAPLLCCRKDATIDEIVSAMRGRGVRRLPVLDDADTLVGIVSTDDVLVALATLAGQVNETLLVEPTLDRAYL